MKFSYFSKSLLPLQWLMTLIIFITGISSIHAVTYPIVDTNQTKCYDNNTEITAPATGTYFYGQDGQINGNQPSYINNGDGTVTDLVTGLTWIKARGSKVTWDEAKAGATTCNVGGYTDWRMPTIKELYSLIDFTGKSGLTDAECVPYINTTYFDIEFGTVTGGRVIDGQDWSATKYVSSTMNGDTTVFGVNFIDGRIKGYSQYMPGNNNVSNTLYVRYVRGNTGYGINSFVNNGDNTITDTATGLMWDKNDSGSGMNWQSALSWVQTKNTAHYLGHNDWRLPNAKEMQSILDYTKSPATSNSPAIDTLFTCSAIKNEGNISDYPFYWTGTTHLDNNGAVYISFGRALGWMKTGTATNYTLYDVHGAGAQRSDPKSGSYTSYLLGTDVNGNQVYGLGPQGDVIRINNYVRLVRDAGSTAKVASPVFSPTPGTFTNATLVTITCSTTGATIRYTTDGSDPTANSLLYANSINVLSTMTLKAKAFKSGLTDSDTTTGTYVIGTAQKVATPTLSPTSGTFTAATQVAISCATANAIIFLHH